VSIFDAKTSVFKLPHGPRDVPSTNISDVVEIMNIGHGDDLRMHMVLDYDAHDTLEACLGGTMYAFG
jgi:hypothetical protein